MTIECVNDFNAHAHAIQMRYDIYLSLDMFLLVYRASQKSRCGLYVYIVRTFLGSNKYKRDQITNVDPLKSNELNAVMRSA